MVIQTGNYNYYTKEIPSVRVYEAARIFGKWDDAGKVSEERYYSSFCSGDLTPWKYSQLKAYYLAEPEPLYVLRYLYKYQKYPMIEYLVKLHLYSLATAVAYNDYGYYNNFPINLQEMMITVRKFFTVY